MCLDIKLVHDAPFLIVWIKLDLCQTFYVSRVAYAEVLVLEKG